MVGGWICVVALGHVDDESCSTDYLSARGLDESGRQPTKVASKGLIAQIGSVSAQLYTLQCVTAWLYFGIGLCFVPTAAVSSKTEITLV